MDIAERRMVLAEQVGDTASLADALGTQAITLSARGCTRSALLILGGVADLARETGDATSLVRTLSNYAAQQLAFDVSKALAASEEAMAYSDRAALTWRSSLYLNRVLGLQVSGGWSEARALIESAPGGDQENRDWPVFVTLRQWQEDDCGLAREPAELDPAPDEQTLAWNWAQRLTIAEREGDAEAMREASAACLQNAYTFGGLGDDYPIFWPRCVQASLDAGALDQAAEQVAFIAATPGPQVSPLLAAELLRMEGMLALHRGEDPEERLREGIAALDAFGAVPDAARTRHALGTWLVQQGRTAEAGELLSAARAVYEELGAAAWLEELGSLGLELRAA
jgi:hypothetical protein